MDRLDPGALDSIAAIARHGNFRRAAVDRGVSASTLSQTLRDIEARLRALVDFLPERRRREGW